MQHVNQRSRYSRSVVFAAAATMMLAVAPLHAQRTFTSFTVFGDSFSDTGNLAQLAPIFGLPLPPSPPFFPGRLSNGPVWVDYMAATERLNLPGDADAVFLTQRSSGNYAIAGATTSMSPISTQVQLGSWLRPAGSVVDRVADPTGLYTYFAGANDMINAARSLAMGDITVEQAQNVATSAALNVGSGAESLAGAGAQFILLPNAVDLGVTPRGRGLGGGVALTELTALYNATLASEITRLRGLFAPTTFFDLRLDILLDNVVRDAASGGSRYGITSTTLPCFVPGAPSCDVSLFSDDLHPTTLGHSLVADAAYRLVAYDRNVAVPEPATWGLTLVGITLIAARRRRKVA